MCAKYYELRCVFYKKIALVKAGAFAWYSVKIRVIFGVRFERQKVDKKQTYIKTETCKLYCRVFEYFFQISSKLIFIILSYTVSKLSRFLRCSVVFCSSLLSVWFCSLILLDTGGVNFISKIIQQASNIRMLGKCTWWNVTCSWMTILTINYDHWSGVVPIQCRRSGMTFHRSHCGDSSEHLQESSSIHEQGWRTVNIFIWLTLHTISVMIIFSNKSLAKLLVAFYVHFCWRLAARIISTMMDDQNGKINCKFKIHEWKLDNCVDDTTLKYFAVKFLVETQ